MTVESLIENRYQIVNRLPASPGGHSRYLLKRINGGNGRAILSFCQPATPSREEALNLQRQIVDLLVRPPMALLCRVIESRIEAGFQMTISEFPGELTLDVLLAEKKALRMDEVEAFLRVLMESCDAATLLGWPRLQLDLSSLALDPRLSLPRIPAPDVPLFNGDEATLIPKDTREYVPAFAKLCCELLGVSPVVESSAALSPRQAALLRQALQRGAETGFASARSFMDELFGANADMSISAHTEKLRMLTVTMTQTSSIGDMPFSALTIKMPPPVPKPSVSVTGALTLDEEARRLIPQLDPTARLRLLPHSEEAPVLTLVFDQWLTLGRSVGGADFIAQFRPRSNVSDARSRRISRVQSRILKLGQKLVVDEDSPMNPSLIIDVPMAAHSEMDLPLTFLLAGEFPLEIRHVPSDYTGLRNITDAPVTDSVALSGALLVRPNGSGVFLNETALVHSDIGIHFSDSGRPWFRADACTMPAARFHRYADQFWLEPLDVTSVSRSKGETKAHELILLQNGVRLVIGAFTYTVQTYSLSDGSTTRGAYTSRRF